MKCPYSVTRENLPGSKLEQIILQGGGGIAKLLPERGGNLFSYLVDGVELLESPTDFSASSMSYGIPVMFPYANRLRDSKFQFNGETFIMQKEGKKIRMHGLLENEIFQCEKTFFSENEAGVTISIEFMPNGLIYRAYPFHLKLSLTYRIRQTGLCLNWSVENKGHQPAPFGFGIHTFFNRIDTPKQTLIKVPAQYMLKTDQCYPTGEILQLHGTDYDLNRWHTLEDLNLDHLFGGVSSQDSSEIKHLASGRKISLRASDDMKYMVIFTPPTHPGGFCLENQTNATNGHNLFAQGKQELSGLIVLPPQGIHAGWITINHSYL